MNLHAATLAIDLHLPEARSLKAKRAAVRPIVEGLRRRFSVAVAEVDHQDKCQRAGLGVAAIGSTVGHVAEVLDSAERFVWSRPDIEVLSIERCWVDHG